MRKYQQLLLVLISSISVFSLLIYRYEYLQLLNVLEVLNFFGYSPENLTNCVLLEDKFFVDLENDNLLAKPPTSWTRYDQHYAYSAFWSSQQQRVHTTLLGPRSAFSDYECRVWFKMADLYTSRSGKFSYNVSINVHGSNIHQYEVYCKPDNIPNDTEPYGILIGKENELRLFIPIEVQREYALKDNLIVCIAPDYSGSPDSYLIELIAYHTLLGVRHFVAYDIGIHYEVLQFVRSIAGHRELYKTFSTLSWQFPIADLQLEKSILEKDCKQRSQSLAKHSILLSIDQYLVLSKDIHSLSDVNNYTFEVKKCCTNPQLKKSWPMAMRKTLCEKRNQTISFIESGKVTDNQTPTTLGSIHQLEETCDKYSGKDDKRMAKFLVNFYNSKLLNIWKSQLKHSINRAKNGL